MDQASSHFLPNTALETNGQAITDSPMDLEFGPDGSLYVLDYGDGFFRANPDAGLYRIDYTPWQQGADRPHLGGTDLEAAVHRSPSSSTAQGPRTPRVVP